MASIQTILGEIPIDFLGFCQCHEHLMLSKGRSFQINPVLLLDDYEKSKQEVLAYRAAGGCSIIDAQPIGCNRMEDGLARLSRETFVNILASTGFHKLSFYPEDHWIFDCSTAQLQNLYCAELTEGMYTDCDTVSPCIQGPCKASIIKTAFDTEGLTKRYENLFTAACLAHKRTGAPIMIHVEHGTNPVLLLDFLLSLQADPSKLIFCHLDRACSDIRIMEHLLNQGCYLEFDTIGRFKYHSDEAELLLIKQLLAAGFEDRLLCSLDTTRARLKAYTPDAIGLDYILKTFIPKMQTTEITANQIHKIFFENAVHVLAKQNNGSN